MSSRTSLVVGTGAIRVAGRPANPPSGHGGKMRTCPPFSSLPDNQLFVMPDAQTNHGCETSDSPPTVTSTARRSRSSFGWSASSCLTNKTAGVALSVLISVVPFSQLQRNRGEILQLPQLLPIQVHWHRILAKVRLVDDFQEEPEQFLVP